jgi:methionyl-tRNA formyltransferase
VRWADPAFGVDRRIRACTPAPGAWTTLRGDRLKLGPVRPVANAAADLKPGELLVERTQVLAGTATTAVILGEIRAAGKKPMPATDWARGLRLAPGEMFE